MLKKGMKGELVRQLQEQLIALEYSCGGAGADGIFGNDTYYAVLNFQEWNGLLKDGIAGPLTLSRLASKDAIPKGLPEKMESGADVCADSQMEALISKFVAAALNENGVVEKKDNITKYGEWYGMNGQPWCAMFVSWCADQAGILATKNSNHRLIPKYASVALGMQWYKEQNRFAEKGKYLPKYGDILFLKTGASHTAIVVGYDNEKVYTIEGNFSDKVSMVWRHVNDSRITGYGVNGSSSEGYILQDATWDGKGTNNTT